MSTARQKRKPVFDPSALDDDLDDLWPARPTDRRGAAGRASRRTHRRGAGDTSGIRAPEYGRATTGRAAAHAGQRGRTSKPVADAGNETDQRRSQRSASTPCHRDCGTRVGPETDPPT